MVDENVIDNVQISDTSVVSPIRRSFYNRLNLPPKIKIVSDKETKVQESPLDARSPQEVLDYHGMYRDPSYYEEHPEKMYMDLTQFDDYETHLNSINAMKEKFSKLPVEIRAKFNHSPQELFSFIGSKEFDIEKLMDGKTLNNYRQYKAKEKADADWQAYLQSDEHKQAVRDQALRAEFEKQQFEAYRASKANSQLTDT